MFRKAGFRIVVPASEECKIQGGRRSIQGMSNVPGKKTAEGLEPEPCMAARQAQSCFPGHCSHLFPLQ